MYSSTAVQKCPLSQFHGNSEHFYIVDSYIYAISNKKGTHLRFHCNSGYANAPHSNVVGALSRIWCENSETEALFSWGPPPPLNWFIPLSSYVRHLFCPPCHPFYHLPSLHFRDPAHPPPFDHVASNRDSSVVTVSVQWAGRSGVHFPAGAGIFLLNVQAGCETNHISHPVGTRCCFYRGQTAGAWSWQRISN